MADTDQRLKDETKKWLHKAVERRKAMTANRKEHKEMLTNIDNYLADSKHFLDKGMLIEAFEASIWAWAWIEIMERMNLATDEGEKTPKVIHETNAILVQDDGKLLLVKRANEPDKGTWCLPGGHVDEGEDNWEAAQREAHEEIGDVVVDKDAILTVESHEVGPEKRFARKHWHINTIYRGRVSGKIRAGDDAEDAKWFTKDELKNANLAGWTRDGLKRLGYL